MSEHSSVYDLGEIDTAARRRERRRSRQARRAERGAELETTDVLTVGFEPPDIAPTSVAAAAAGGAGIEVTWEDRGDPQPDWAGSLSLFLAGGTHLLRGQTTRGIFFQVTLAFVFALAWAILDSLDRLGPNLSLLGLPAESAVWALGALFFAAALVHVANLVTAPASTGALGGRHACHPAIAGAASFLLPGWGQVLSGERHRAIPFVAGLWIVAAAWILVSPAAQTLFAERNLVLPPWLVAFTSPAVRWTLPAVIWALAVHDAVVRAQAAREA